MAYKRLTDQRSVNLKDLKCICGTPYIPLTDADADDTPPSYVARLFMCDTCNTTGWLEPYDFGLDDWNDVEEFEIV